MDVYRLREKLMSNAGAFSNRNFWLRNMIEEKGDT